LPSIFLPKYSGVRPTISRHEYDISTNIKMPKRPAPTRRDHLAELDVDERHHTAEWIEAIVHGIDGPHDVPVVTVANSAEFAAPKRVSLPPCFVVWSSGIAANAALGRDSRCMPW